MRTAELIHELTIPIRIEILNVLRDKTLNLSSIYGELNNRKLNAPLSTISRHVKTLHELGLIRKSEGKYAISGTGMFLLDLIVQLNDISVWDEINISSEFVALLPNELKLGLSTLKNAEIERDVYSAIFKAFEAVENAKSWGKYIDRIIHYDIYKTMLLKNLEGVSEKVISSRDTLKRRVGTFLKALIDLNLSKNELEIIKSKCEWRVMDLPVQLGVIDGEVAFFQILKKNRESPIYISRDKKCIKWVTDLFDFFWEKAEPFYLSKHVDALKF
ncbi:hypothetical protein DRO97_01410 [Archaeoglobales archaeon]|nr:MAG: hypothetical protein DRO97_01410 [Archaeoglobales archaeon]